MYIAFGILLFSLLVYYAVPWLIGKYLRHLLRMRTRSIGAVCLTFDDGPGSKLTPAILDILAEHNVKATFFLLGRNIPGREEIVRQIADQGHEICSHGYGHLHYWKVSPIRALSDIRRGWKAIDAALGIEGQKYPFRPPYGKLNIVCLLYLWICQVPIGYWTLDSGDTWLPKEKGDSKRTVTLVRKAGGAVILAHDFDRSDDSNDCFVLESLQSILAMTEQSDLQMLTVSQLMENKK